MAISQEEIEQLFQKIKPKENQPILPEMNPFLIEEEGRPAWFILENNTK